jgi:hypothetical protein
MWVMVQCVLTIMEMRQATDKDFLRTDRFFCWRMLLLLLLVLLLLLLCWRDWWRWRWQWWRRRWWWQWRTEWRKDCNGGSLL